MALHPERAQRRSFARPSGRSFMSQIPMAHQPRSRFRTYMRGGTSKGVFFRLQDLPEAARCRCCARQAVHARDRQPRPIFGAHRRHGRCHIEHQQMRHPVEEQSARSRRRASMVRCRSTSPSSTGAATAATFPRVPRCTGLVDAAYSAERYLWCASGRPISARRSSPTSRSLMAVQETGDFELDGVTFPAAESCWNSSIRPTTARRADRCSTGNLVDELEVPVSVRSRRP